MRKFYDKEGVLRLEDELELFADDTEFYDSVLALWDRQSVSNKFQERKWRNTELADTDWMLVADATYGGEPLAGSEMLASIKTYRDNLRSYDLVYANRPVRPEWYNPTFTR